VSKKAISYTIKLSPLFPPFSKGDLKAINYFRIALKLIHLDLGELEVLMGLGQVIAIYFGFGPRFCCVLLATPSSFLKRG